MSMIRVAIGLALSASLAGCATGKPASDPAKTGTAKTGTAATSATAPTTTASTTTTAAAASAAPSDPATTPGLPAAHLMSRGPKLSAAQVAAMTQARESVSDAAIMRQLADRAERIAQELNAGSPPPAPTNINSGSNRALGYALMIQFGWPASQWPALDALWNRESGWDQYADNPSSHAYGIPQSLPATKMAVVGPDWQTNPSTQIRWGLAYIGQRYGSPLAAWAHEEQAGWY